MPLCRQDINVGDWMIRQEVDDKGNISYKIPAGTIVKSGKSLKVATIVCCFNTAIEIVLHVLNWIKNRFFFNDLFCRAIT